MNPIPDYEIDALELFEVDCLLRRPIFDNCGQRHPLVVFVAGRAEGDYEWLLTEAAEPMESADHVVCIPGHDGSYSNGIRVPTGYPGFESWKSELESEHGFPPERIFSCVLRSGHEKQTHTREEAEGFVLRAREQKWDAAYVLAHAHQMPRLMCCLLGALQEFSYPMGLVPMFSSYTEWDEPIYGSLGQEQKPRWEHIKEEFDRLQRYIQNGWAAPLSALKAYLLEPNPWVKSN